MKVAFYSAGLKRLGQKRVEVAAGQPVDVEWSDLERHSPDSFEIVREVAPEPEPAQVELSGPPRNPAAGPEPEPSTSGADEAERPAAPAGKRGR